MTVKPEFLALAAVAVFLFRAFPAPPHLVGAIGISQKEVELWMMLREPPQKGRPEIVALINLIKSSPEYESLSFGQNFLFWL
ncbi:hypothetical protein [Rhizobium lentis]|uniref:Uncharacterized protein n=1 Tax=Rhizobium lentis TaxID=1138194 RepID=A0ABS7IA30_9HYPH|nr:hypothetical protein [Rhizobium lentis]MBX5088316.1 hypothetical protein [Rhizobium lentis]